MHVSSADDIHDWAATAKPGDTLVYWTGANLAECRHMPVVMQLAGYAAPGARASRAAILNSSIGAVTGRRSSCPSSVAFPKASPTRLNARAFRGRRLSDERGSVGPAPRPAAR